MVHPQTTPTARTRSAQNDGISAIIHRPLAQSAGHHNATVATSMASNLPKHVESENFSRSLPMDSSSGDTHSKTYPGSFSPTDLMSDIGASPPTSTRVSAQHIALHQTPPHTHSHAKIQTQSPSQPWAAVYDKVTKSKGGGSSQNHSPFRRKSIKDEGSNDPQITPAQPLHASQSISGMQRVHTERAATPDAIEANASVALNIGGNIFQVTTPEMMNPTTQRNSGLKLDGHDPIATALAKLKCTDHAGTLLSCNRISADHYHGILAPSTGVHCARDALKMTYHQLKSCAGNSESSPMAGMISTSTVLPVPFPSLTKLSSFGSSPGAAPLSM